MADDVYELQIFGNIGPQPCENVLHFDRTGSASGAPQISAKRCVAAWQSSIEAAYLAPLPQDYNLRGYKCKRINNGGGPTFILPVPATPGGQAADVSVSGIAPVLIWSYQEGPKFRAGRTFMPGIDESNISQNTFSPGIDAVYATLITALLNTMSNVGEDFIMGIWSRTHSAIRGVLAGTLSLKPGIMNKRMKPVI